MNPYLNDLHPYPFEKLASLKGNIKGNPDLPHIALSIGEPKHAPPAFVLDKIVETLPGVTQYPATKGLPELRKAISNWLDFRFNLRECKVDPERHVLPVNGSREALFAIAQAVVDPTKNPLVMLPNPFYQIYEGAAFLAGAEPHYLNCTEENGFLPNFKEITEEQWQRCQLVYLCSPNNPTGVTASLEDYCHLIELADKYDFIIASDECYSEIFPNEEAAPAGLLQACEQLGRDDFNRCIIFHSLSKRSNLPGLRSGFVAGDEKIMKPFLQYRTYHGCAMSTPIQLASISAWEDEDHVTANREVYRRKFSHFHALVNPHWELSLPQAGFNFWAKTPIDDKDFAIKLFEEQNITVLPGSYLSRDINGVNPGQNFVRMALVASFEECDEAAHRIVEFIKQL